MPKRTHRLTQLDGPANALIDRIDDSECRAFRAGADFSEARPDGKRCPSITSERKHKLYDILRHDLAPSDLGVGLFWSKPDPRCRLSRECRCLRHILSSRFGIVITTMAGYLLFEEKITVLKVAGPLLT